MVCIHARLSQKGWREEHPVYNTSLNLTSLILRQQSLWGKKKRSVINRALVCWTAGRITSDLLRAQSNCISFGLILLDSSIAFNSIFLEIFFSFVYPEAESPNKICFTWLLNDSMSHNSTCLFSPDRLLCHVFSCRRSDSLLCFPLYLFFFSCFVYSSFLCVCILFKCNRRCLLWMVITSVELT